VRINTFVMATSFALAIVAFVNRNDLPGSLDRVPALSEAPRQRPSDEQPFVVSYKDIEYRVEPQYEYDLVGLVVSFRHHDGRSRMHRRSNDHLNMLDVCVLWGDTASNPYLPKIDFWNGIFTCNVSTRDENAWESFDMTELSNNHLLSADDFIRNEVRDIRVGDQIRVSGALASYVSGNGSRRGTSTTRTDTGDGACETIYVREFQIVRAATSYWRLSLYAALGVLTVTLFIHFRRPYRPYRA
jgi:hypothetical protein